MKRESDTAELYLDLMKKCLTRYIFPEKVRPLRRPPLTIKHLAWVAYPPIAAILEKKGVRLYCDANVDLARREEGRDWPADAETMIGLKRLDNLHSCIQQVLRADVPGDFIETGVWRGGACIFMRAALSMVRPFRSGAIAVAGVKNSEAKASASASISPELGMPCSVRCPSSCAIVYRRSSVGISEFK